MILFSAPFTRTLTAALRSFDAAGIEVQDVGLRRPTLDDVFLSVTGHGTDTIGPSGSKGTSEARSTAELLVTTEVV